MKINFKNLFLTEGTLCAMNMVFHPPASTNFVRVLEFSLRQEL
jgi:hypothetical protein